MENNAFESGSKNSTAFFTKSGPKMDQNGDSPGTKIGTILAPKIAPILKPKWVSIF